MGARLDVTGVRFGRLVAVSATPNPPRGWKWKCKCDCGGTTTVPVGSLRSGNTTSCGCHKRSVLPISTTKHGAAGTPLYEIWKSMRQRCNTPTNKAYKNYGAIGVKVCKRWDKFENFRADMGERPPGRSLDRYPNNKGDYKPSNCRWATPQEQARNMRVNRLLTKGGVTACLSEWAEILGVDPSTLHERIAKYGVQRALKKGDSK